MKCLRRHNGTRPTRPKIAHSNRASIKLQTQNKEILIEPIQGPFFTVVERFWGKACTFELVRDIVNIS